MTRLQLRWFETRGVLGYKTIDVGLGCGYSYYLLDLDNREGKGKSEGMAYLFLTGCTVGCTITGVSTGSV
jgi:hypothetical protein